MKTIKPIDFQTKVINKFKNPPTNEQSLVKEFFGNKKTGFYVDIGANDPVHESQTFCLDSIGWDGLLVEPLPYYQNLLKEKRSGKVIPFACSNPDNHYKSLPLTDKDSHSSLDLNWFESNNRSSQDKTIDVMCRTLDSILEDNEVNPGFEFISIDIEGHEIEMLKGFDVVRWCPKLILMEDHVFSHQKHNYMLSSGYKLIMRTGLNSWYVPKSSGYHLTLRAYLSFFRKFWLGTLVRKIKYRNW
jgi:FkbM family methyltransferase